MTFPRMNGGGLPTVTQANRLNELCGGSAVGVKKSWLKRQRAKPKIRQRNPKIMKFKEFVKKHGTPRRAKTYRETVHQAMHDYKYGKLRSYLANAPKARQPKVTQRNQAIAISLSIARKKAYGTLLRKLGITLKGMALEGGLLILESEGEKTDDLYQIKPESESVADHNAGEPVDGVRHD